MSATTFYDLQQAAPVIAPPGPPAPTPKAHRPGRGRNRQQAAPGAAPQLSIGTDYRCTLGKAMQVATGLGPGAAFVVVVPARPGGEWYLDTQPRPGAGRRLPARPAADGVAVVRLPPIARQYFLHRQPRRRNRSQHYPRLYFELGPEVPGQLGYYRLLPVAAPVKRNGRARLPARRAGEQLWLWPDTYGGYGSSDGRREYAISEGQPRQAQGGGGEGHG